MSSRCRTLYRNFKRTDNCSSAWSSSLWWCHARTRCGNSCVSTAKPAEGLCPTSAAGSNFTSPVSLVESMARTTKSPGTSGMKQEARLNHTIIVNYMRNTSPYIGCFFLDVVLDLAVCSIVLISRSIQTIMCACSFVFSCTASRNTSAKSGCNFAVDTNSMHLLKQLRIYQDNQMKTEIP